MSIKDKLYDYVVRKNENVRYEYERYVMEHTVEHYENRRKHWKILWKLNWHYRVKKKNEPMMYWDKDVKAQRTEFMSVASKKIQGMKNMCVSKKDIFAESESGASRKDDEYRFMKKLLKYDVISFDVFDTLLFRPFTSPYDAFILLQKKYGVLNFEKIRKMAAQRAFERNKTVLGIREISIRDIYEEIHQQTGIDIDEGINNEIQLEKDICYANEYMLTVFNLLKSQKKKIIAVSDMYLPKEVVLELLESNGFVGFDSVYVSSEYGYGKNDGLFLNVCNDFKGNAIVHIGDNKQKDFVMPQKVGIDSILYRSVEYMGKSHRSKGLSGVVASAYAGVVNSELHMGKNRYSIPFEYGFVNGGIYILGFCNWLIELKKMLLVDSVLFLARDGYIINKVYTNIFKETDSKYAFWSRLAGLRICAIKDKYNFVQESLIKRKKDEKIITINEWLNVMGLDFLEDKLVKHGLRREYPLVETNINRMVNVIDKYWEEITEVYSRESEVAKQYYVELIGKKKRILLVDVGWQGQSILQLKWLIKEHWKIDCEVECAMVASYPTDETANQTMILSKEIHTYAFSLGYNNDLYRFFKRNSDKTIKSWFEMFTQAPHPTFEKFYQKKDGSVAYKFGFPEVENYSFVNEVQSGIYHFCELYHERFYKYPFMLQISGADALRPFIDIMQNEEKIKEIFKDVYFPMDSFAGAINANPKRAIDYL